MNQNDKRIQAYKKAQDKNDENKNKEGLLKVSKGGDSQGHMPDSIYRRVAKFLLLIGVNEAAKILPHLSPEQTEKIIPEIASIRSVSADEAVLIFAEFQSMLERSRQSGGVETARTILEKAFGPDKAKTMLEKSIPYPEGKPFDYLQEMEAEKIFQLLKDEAVPVSSLVLSRLKPILAAGVIKRMDTETQKQVLLRLAKLPAMPPDIVRRIDRAMHEKVQAMQTGALDKIDGRSALAEILKKMNAGGESSILSTLSDIDPELGQDLRERLFTTEDIVNADDRFVQEKLRAMSDRDIALLIVSKSEAFRSKILANVSKGRGDLILEEENLAKPIRKKDSDDITNDFFSMLRRAWESGKLHIRGRDEDVYI